MKALGLFGWLAAIGIAMAADPATTVRNDKVSVVEETLAPGATEVLGSETHPRVTVFLDDGRIQFVARQGGTPVAKTVHRGEVLFRRADAGSMSVAGDGAVRCVRVDLLNAPAKDTWGMAGFAPDYRLLVENGWVRAYDIRIPAGKSEPQHTHHDRVVVCLSGAELRHVLADGHQEDSTLKTGQIAWRKGQTHVGRNIGQTDLWVIAIEPK